MGTVKDPVLILCDMLTEIEFLERAIDGQTADDVATNPILFRALFLAHGYDRVTTGVLWRAIQDDILPLKEGISAARDDESNRAKAYARSRARRAINTSRRGCLSPARNAGRSA
jgi:hypothetical protein